MKQQVPTPGQRIDYELFLDCVHCGLCTAACPTYVELGTEMDSPRGRIYLMRAVTDGRLPLDQDVRKHLDLCLDCRACESACPSGVQYGKLLEPFRADVLKLDEAHGTSPTSLPWWQRFTLFHVFPYRRRVKLALLPAKLLQMFSGDWLLGNGPTAREIARLQTFGIDWLLRKLMPKRLRQMHDLLPPVPLWPPAIPEFLPAVGKRRARVALFLGCVNDALFPHVNWATAKVLQHNGCDVWTPRSQVCCGALHYHAGQEAPALEFAKQNCKVFLDSGLRTPDSAPLDAIIMNVAGCGSMRHEIGHLLEHTEFAERGRQLAAKMRDVSEFLMELGPVPPTQPLNLRATYHDACHLCHAQQIRKQPRQLLEMIPGLQLVPLNESEICCGAAGSYNLTQPEMAERLGERKARNLLDTKPQAVFTGNAGCLLQIAKHVRDAAPHVWVAHPVEALWAGYAGGELWRSQR